jgi:hypothetical protein
MKKLFPKLTRDQKTKIEAEGLDGVTPEEAEAYRLGEYIPENIRKALGSVIEEIRLRQRYGREKKTFEMTEDVFDNIRGVAISILNSRFYGTDKGFPYCIPIAINQLYKEKNKKEKNI